MTVTQLTTLAAVKAWLVIPTAVTTDDTLLTNLITAISGACQSYCNRNFGSASYTEIYNGNNQPSLFLKQRPITAVASVTIGRVSVPASTYPGGPGFAFDSNRVYIVGSWGVDGVGWGSWGRGFVLGAQNVVVAYTAGLAFTQAAFPDLFQAATEWAALEYKALTHIDKITEGLAAGGTTTYLNKIPPFAQIVLDRYKQVAIVSPLGY